MVKHTKTARFYSPSPSYSGGGGGNLRQFLVFETHVEEIVSNSRTPPKAPRKLRTVNQRFIGDDGLPIRIPKSFATRLRELEASEITEAA